MIAPDPKSAASLATAMHDFAIKMISPRLSRFGKSEDIGLSEASA